MASASSPVYNNPAISRNHGRRASTRQSFTSSRSASRMDSARTLCPRDVDAFSYDPSHLPAWYIAQDLWERLPSNVQTHLAAIQHAGAAVLTGYERLEKHTEARDNDRANNKLAEDEFLGELDVLPSPKMRTMSNASSVAVSDVASAVFTEPPASESELGSPSVTSSHSTSPVSPICLGPPHDPLKDKRGRSRDRSFSVPLEPLDAHYAVELSHLSTEAIPRLDHAGRKVDLEWLEAKRISKIAVNDVAAFEEWWAEKKRTIYALKEETNRLSRANNLSPNGMGWTAP